VVVPTHAGALDWLGECLTGLISQTGEVVPEILVVFDGPAPDAIELTRRIIPAARQVRLERSRGFAPAATAGLRAARGGLIALINDDAVLEQDWVEAILSASERHPDAGSFASRIVQHSRPSKIDSAGHGLTRWGEAFSIGQGMTDGAFFEREQEVFGAPAAAAVFRREMIRDTGGLSEGLEAYLEDIDLSLRAQNLGFPCMYIPDARVRHRGSSSYRWGRKGNGRAERLAARNRIRVLARSMPRNSLRSGGPAALASIGADVTQRLVRGNHGIATLRGTLEGLRDLPEALKERPRTLGARRVDDDWMRRVMRLSEDRLLELASAPDAGTWRRLRARLASGLRTWVDRRENRIRQPVW